MKSKITAIQAFFFIVSLAITALNIGPLVHASSGMVTSLYGGGAGQIPYQSAANTTAFLAAGTAGQVFTSGGAGAPTWGAAGGTQVPILASTSINLNVATKQTLYTCPGGKSCIITAVVFRSASGNLSGHDPMNLGWNAGSDNWVNGSGGSNVSLSITASTQQLEVIPINWAGPEFYPSVFGTAGQTFGFLDADTFAATCTVDVIGYTF